MTRTCGGVPALSVSAARCSTPNRCCSSTTTSPRSKNWTCSSSSAWVPITIPASPIASRESGSVRCALVIEPVSSSTLVAAHHPAGREVAEHRGDRAVVLLGEHLGRREQRGLAAGVDHAQHRPQRDQGLAGADLALEQPVHRVRLGEVVLDLGADLALPARELERQPCVERREQPAVAAVARPRPHRPDRPAAPAEHQLGDQGLLEPVAVLGALDLAPRVGRVDPVERLAGVEHVVLLPDLVGEQLGQLVDDRPREADGLLEVPGVDVLGERVDRVERADRLQRQRRQVLVAGAEQDHLRVGELPVVAELPDLAHEDAAAALAQPLLVPLGHVGLLGEERHPQRRALGAEHDLLAVRRPVGTPVLVGLAGRGRDLADHGEELSLLELVQRRERAGLEVAPREVAQQVADRPESQTLGDALVARDWAFLPLATPRTDSTGESR